MELVEKIQDLKALLKLLRAVGVQKFSHGRLELEFGPDPNAKIVELGEPIGAVAGMPTEDELLMWSAGGELPEVTASPPDVVK